MGVQHSEPVTLGFPRAFGLPAIDHAFEALFTEHYPRLVKTLVRLTGHSGQAEELASDAFYKLHRHGPQANPAGWLYRTAINLGLDALRANGRRLRREAALEAQARELGFPERVHLFGFRSDIATLLAGATIFVHPSLSEGLPLAILEAMFAARPIVATNVGEIATVLGADAGTLVPPGDESALASAIDGLLHDPARARAMGERAAERAAAEYSLARSVARYADLYASLVSSAP